MTYLELLRLPGVARLAVASLLGRIPIVMVSLSYILLLRALGRPFALAGAVAGTVAIAAGVAAIPQGRLVDRLRADARAHPARAGQRDGGARGAAHRPRGRRRRGR